MEDFPVSLTILDQFSFERRMFEDIMYSIVFIHTLKRFLRINISYCAFDKLKSVLHLIKYI